MYIYTRMVFRQRTSAMAKRAFSNSPTNTSSKTNACASLLHRRLSPPAQPSTQRPHCPRPCKYASPPCIFHAQHVFKISLCTQPPAPDHSQPHRMPPAHKRPTTPRTIAKLIRSLLLVHTLRTSAALNCSEVTACTPYYTVRGWTWPSPENQPTRPSAVIQSPRIAAQIFTSHNELSIPTPITTRPLLAPPTYPTGRPGPRGPARDLSR